MSIQAPQDHTLHVPRILCLHGGGTNARIFRAQCRVLKRHLEGTFRLVFAEAPFSSQAGPDVVSVYRDFGPFKRWLRWLPSHPPIDPLDGTEAIEESLSEAMRADDLLGATGEWVALLGFSQGAKVCASLMFRQQVRTEKLGRYRAGTHFRFAVLLAGRGPLVSFDPELVMTPALVDTSMIGLMNVPDERTFEGKDHILRLPTIHVHGIRDQGLELHRHLLERYCEKQSTRLIEWDGDHRVPIKERDVAAVVREIYNVARQTSVLRK